MNGLMRARAKFFKVVFDGNFTRYKGSAFFIKRCRARGFFLRNQKEWYRRVLAFVSLNFRDMGFFYYCDIFRKVSIR